MRSIKAIVTGSLFIIVVILLMQLAYIFIAVGYNSLAHHYPFLNEISGYFRYFIVIPVFMVIMFFGGYITADIANTRVLLHCIAVGIITAGGTIWLALQNSNLTLTGILIFILALGATLAGGLHWKRGHKINNS
jgi:hypothetical protein